MTTYYTYDNILHVLKQSERLDLLCNSYCVWHIAMGYVGRLERHHPLSLPEISSYLKKDYHSTSSVSNIKQTHPNIHDTASYLQRPHCIEFWRLNYQPRDSIHLSDSFSTPPPTYGRWSKHLVTNSVPNKTLWIRSVLYNYGYVIALCLSLLCKKINGLGNYTPIPRTRG